MMQRPSELGFRGRSASVFSGLGLLLLAAVYRGDAGDLLSFLDDHNTTPASSSCWWTPKPTVAGVGVDVGGEGGEERQARYWGRSGAEESREGDKAERGEGVPWGSW